MQDAYAGDVGDFGKFVMLDAVCRSGGRNLKLGINWYFVPSPRGASNDGRHTGYLDPSNTRFESFRSCSPRIFDALSGLVVTNNRTVAGLESLHLLPRYTRFFSDPLLTSERSRTGWFEASMRTFAGCNVMFLDPDNGIQPEYLSPREQRSAKYAFVDEIAAYYQSGKSVVVYNHRDRSPKRRYDGKFRTVHQAIGIRVGVRVLRFKRYSVRDYMFIPQEFHRAMFDRVAAALFTPPLDFLFEAYNPDG